MCFIGIVNLVSFEKSYKSDQCKPLIIIRNTLVIPDSLKFFTNILKKLLMLLMKSTFCFLGINQCNFFCLVLDDFI